MPNPHAEYIAKGNWRCGESPTGAHWWLCRQPQNGKVRGRCKFCGAGREFDQSDDHAARSHGGMSAVGRG